MLIIITVILNPNIIQKTKTEDTVWTFDTGASEHTIGNKNILTNFEKEKVTLDVQIIQPTNLKEVEHMNGHGSKHKTVLYSSKINKNLISGIKLIKEGLICKY